MPNIRAGRGLSIDEFLFPGEKDRKPWAPDSMSVTGGIITKGGMASLFVQEEPMPAEEAALQVEKQGCA
ncbi:hypothetical protein E1295_06960 [Nonomuraea mesophila]|uniref:Uncharacterized protein n=1 Tax=Nonomuraea mesophila TaxID=2530382 RepID=A0A4R5FVC3_9ACTN|nr:hypothetical protein [Nonomuraea mesophila]TDE57703.1 hypothetical protein E1295_06960 [Nonomuraea mesophila]